MHLKFLALAGGLLGESMASEVPGSPGVVPMPFTVHRPTFDINVLKKAQALRKRDDGSAALSLTNLLTSYIVELQVGTPPQKISTILDTGSSDLWVMAEGNPYCEGASNQDTSSQPVDCSTVTMFKSGDSSTFSEQSTDFSISYGDGSAALGKFVQDTIQIGSFSISKANFALASKANTTMAVFGVGPIYGESTVTKVTQDGGAETTYDNILAQMKSQGYIASLSFSLWLNQANSGQGNILFGGVDHAKYKGSLTLLPILRDLNPGAGDDDMELKQARSASIVMTGLGLYKDNDTEMIASGNLPVLLDSGTSLTYLPDDYVEVLGNSLGATWSAPINMYITTCEHDGGVIFELAGTQFHVPFQQMIYYLTEDGSNGTPTNATDENGDPICGLGVMSSGGYSDGGIFILGETFLRGVYVSYDYDNWQVGIAEADYSSDAVLSSSVDTIGTGGIPSATSAASYSSTSFDNSFTTNRATLFNSDGSIDNTRSYRVDTTASSEAATSTGSGSSSTEGSSSSSSSGESALSSTNASSSSSHSNPAVKVTVLTGLMAPLLSIFLSI